MWRELLIAGIDDGMNGWDGAEAAAALLGMPASDRIAMARELLAGTDRCVARDVPEITTYPSDPLSVREKRVWNACRRSMLETP